MREYGPLIAASRSAQPKLQTFVRIEWNDSDADDSALDPIEFEAAVAAGSHERDFDERSPDDIYVLYTGGTTGMPKGVMWRQEDVYFALAGGIDVFTHERNAYPEVASEKIDASQPSGLVMLIVPPFMPVSVEPTESIITVYSGSRSCSCSFTVCEKIAAVLLNESNDDTS